MNGRALSTASIQEFLSFKIRVSSKREKKATEKYLEFFSHNEISANWVYEKKHTLNLSQNFFD